MTLPPRLLHLVISMIYYFNDCLNTTIGVVTKQSQNSMASSNLEIVDHIIFDFKTLVTFQEGDKFVRQKKVYKGKKSYTF